MAFVIGVDRLNPGEYLVRGLEGKEPFARRQVPAEARVLHDGGAPRGQITFGAVAEPAATGADVSVLGDAEFGLRALKVITITPQVARDAHRVNCLPAA